MITIASMIQRRLFVTIGGILVLHGMPTLSSSGRSSSSASPSVSFSPDKYLAVGPCCVPLQSVHVLLVSLLSQILFWLHCASGLTLTWFVAGLFIALGVLVFPGSAAGLPGSTGTGCPVGVCASIVPPSV